MKKWMLAALISIGLILTAAATGCAKKSVARVNGKLITQEQFYQELEKGTTGRNILDRLITSQVVNEEARKKNITVSDAEVNEVLDGVKKTMEPGQWQQLLERQGLTENDIREDFRFRILLAKVFVGEDGMKKFFEENRARFDRPAQVRYRQIVVGNKDEALAIRSELVDKKADFAALAKAKSIDTYSKERGGEMSPVYEGTVEKALGDVLFKLKPQEISEPIAAIYPEGAYRIVQVTQRTEPVKATYENSKKDVIMAVLSQKIMDIMNQMNALKAKAKIEIYNPKYTSLLKEYQAYKQPPARPAPPQPAAPAPTPAPAPKAEGGASGSK